MHYNALTEEELLREASSCLTPTPLEAALTAALRATLEKLDAVAKEDDGYDDDGCDDDEPIVASRTGDAPAHRVGDTRYDSLKHVLNRAFDQAACGKGNDRHAGGAAFENQPMQLTSRMLKSADGMAFQAIKKVREGLALPTTDRQVAEMLGAIVYIAGIVVYLENDHEHTQVRP